MNGRERLREILAHKSDHCGFWHGNPNPASRDYIFSGLGVKDDFEMGIKLGDSCRWVMPEGCGMWQHPEGKPMFDVLGGKKRITLQGLFPYSTLTIARSSYTPDVVVEGIANGIVVTNSFEETVQKNKEVIDTYYKALGNRVITDI